MLEICHNHARILAELVLFTRQNKPFSSRITDLKKKWFVYLFHFDKITNPANRHINKLLMS